MAADPFRRVLVPVASPADARATFRTLLPHLERADGEALVVHVVEKAGGAPDKASVAQREQYAREIFSEVADCLADADVTLETRILYGTDVATTIVEAAHEHGVDAIAFTPRGGSRWVKLLLGDVASDLIAESDLPVVVLPDAEGDP